jgi:hypothetical protein
MQLMSRRMVSFPDRTGESLFAEMFTAARRDPDVGTRVAESLTAMEGEIRKLIERAKNDGDVAADQDAAVIARFCLAVGVGFSHLRIAGLADPDAAKWTALTQQLIASLGRDPSPPARRPGATRRPR